MSHRLLPLLLLVVLLMPACAAEEGVPSWPLDPETGLRVPALPPVPDLEPWPDNPHTEAGFALGQALFNDPRLSGSGAATCANCHLPSAAFQSNAVTDLPDRSFPHMEPVLLRNTNSLLNLVHAPVYHWDGKPADDLYDVLALPLAEPQMNLTDHPAEEIWLIDKSQAIPNHYKRLTMDVPAYIPWFEDAFGVNIVDVEPEELWTLTGKALALFMRKARSTNSAFDRWNAGEDGAISASAIRGVKVFTDMQKGGCIACHSGPLLSDFRFHNLSLALPDENGLVLDEGRKRVTGLDSDRGFFLTPMLRDVTRTSPFFHDGSVASLWEVLEQHLDAPGRLDPLHDPFLDHMGEVTQSERADLIEFLSSLEGEPLPIEMTTVFVDLPLGDGIPGGLNPTGSSPSPPPAEDPSSEPAAEPVEEEIDDAHGDQTKAEETPESPPLIPLSGTWEVTTSVMDLDTCNMSAFSEMGKVGSHFSVTSGGESSFVIDHGEDDMAFSCVLDQGTHDFTCAPHSTVNETAQSFGADCLINVDVDTWGAFSSESSMWMTNHIEMDASGGQCGMVAMVLSTSFPCEATTTMEAVFNQ